MSISDVSAERLAPTVLDHLAIMWRRRLVVLLFAALAATAVFVFRSALSDTYASTTTVRFVIPTGAPETADDLDVLSRTYGELAETSSFLEMVAREAVPALDPDDLEDRLDVNRRLTPGFVNLRATGPNSTDAAGLAALAATVLIEAVESDQGGADVGGAALVRAVVVSTDTPSAPVSPRPRREAALAALVAGLLAAEGSVLLRRLRGRLSLADPGAEASALAGVSTLVVRDADEVSAVATPFFLENLDDVEALVVVQRGVRADAAIAASMAQLATQLGRRVLIVDTDPNGAAMHKQLGLPLRPGLTEILDGSATLETGSYRSLTGPNLVAVPAGGPRPASVRLVPALVEAMAGSGADLSILSATAESSDADVAIVVDQFPEAVVLVADGARLRRRDLVRIVRSIRSAGGRLRGVVLVDPKRRRMT